MMEVSLRFTLPEDKDELRHAQLGLDYHMALIDIADNIFRPARKHGYSDKALNDLLEKTGEDGTELISQLESEFFDIIEEYGIKLC